VGPQRARPVMTSANPSLVTSRPYAHAAADVLRRLRNDFMTLPSAAEHLHVRAAARPAPVMMSAKMIVFTVRERGTRAGELGRS